MLPWDLEMTVEESLSDDEDDDGVPHCEQISFITGARSVNKEDLNQNLKLFNVPEAIIQSIFETRNESIRCIREYSQMYV
jgi:hypothetical protein